MNMSLKDKIPALDSTYRVCEIILEVNYFEAKCIAVLKCGDLQQTHLLYSFWNYYHDRT